MHLHICLPRATCAWATVLALFLVVMAGPTRAPQYARVSTVGLQGQRCQVSADFPLGVVAPGKGGGGDEREGSRHCRGPFN